MSTPPKVSVIVPNYNYCRYLPQRMESIFKQTFKDYEIILLDDCSTDGSKELIETYSKEDRVTACVVNEKNSGSPFVQWNKGLSMARGEYVWIAESDDYCEETFLNTMVAALDTTPSASFALSGSLLVDEQAQDLNLNFDHWKKEDRKTLIYNGNDYAKHFLIWKNTAYNASMIVFRRKCAEEVDKGFESLHYCGDWLFWSEMAQEGDVIEIHQKLNRFRRTLKSVTSKSLNSQFAQLKEELLVLSYIWTHFDVDSYRLACSKGQLIKKARRAKLIATERNALLGLFKSKDVKVHYFYVERFFKTFSQIMPFITTPNNDKCKHLEL